MAKHIDADAFNAKLQDEFHGMISDESLKIYKIILRIDDTPAADVAEVKRGHWFFTDYDYFDCSECGEAYYNGCESTKEAEHRLETGEVYTYCPYCGAKMKED